METTERTTSGIRNVLFEELDALRRGESTPSKANAIAKTCGQIVGTVKLELDYMKYNRSLGTTSKEVSGGGTTRVLQLG